MNIAVPRETAEGETRTALTPLIAGQLVASGNTVLVQAGAGAGAHFPDAAYAEAGATIVPDAPALYGQADLVLRVGRPSNEEIEMLRPNTVLIGTLGTLSNPALAERLAERGITSICMDAIPRITRAQSMDSLSSARARWAGTRRSSRRRAAPQVHAAAHHRGGHGPSGARASSWVRGWRG